MRAGPGAIRGTDVAMRQALGPGPLALAYCERAELACPRPGGGIQAEVTDAEHRPAGAR
jgi:hypothetical protein